MTFKEAIVYFLLELQNKMSKLNPQTPEFKTYAHICNLLSWQPVGENDELRAYVQQALAHMDEKINALQLQISQGAQISLMTRLGFFVDLKSVPAAEQLLPGYLSLRQDLAAIMKLPTWVAQYAGQKESQEIADDVIGLWKAGLMRNQCALVRAESTPSGNEHFFDALKIPGTCCEAYVRYKDQLFYIFTRLYSGSKAEAGQAVACGCNLVMTTPDVIRQFDTAMRVNDLATDTSRILSGAELTRADALINYQRRDQAAFSDFKRNVRLNKNVVTEEEVVADVLKTFIQQGHYAADEENALYKWLSRYGGQDGGVTLVQFLVVYDHILAGTVSGQLDPAVVKLLNMNWMVEENGKIHGYCEADIPLIRGVASGGGEKYLFVGQDSKGQWNDERPEWKPGSLLQAGVIIELDLIKNPNSGDIEINPKVMALEVRGYTHLLQMNEQLALKPSPTQPPADAGERKLGI